MKKIYCLSFFFLVATLASLAAQENMYSQAINHVEINLRGATNVLGTIEASFPSDGYVVVHFDGTITVSVGDRIVLAASNTGDWGANDGHVAIESSKPGFARPFSHTRVYSVAAGTHTFYAVGQNAVEMDGSGRATIHGTLSVEYFPSTGTATVSSSSVVFSGNVLNTTVVGDHTIHANGPGKVLVRFDGYITSDANDRVVLAASNTTSWSFNDGNVAVEAVSGGEFAGDVDQNSFSHTRVYNVSSAGDYTYYALAETYGKEFGDGNISAYGNLLVEYYPSTASEKILHSGYSHTEIDLNGEPKTLASITMNAPSAGKVMVVMDGYWTAYEGYDIVVAASNTTDYTPDDGNVTLEALDNDQNRYSYSHTRVYNIPAGDHTFYALGEIFGGSGSETADLFGALTVRYFPSMSTSVADISDLKNSFDVYPNPSGGEVFISFKQPMHQDSPIQLIDMNGRVIKEYIKNGEDIMRLDLSMYRGNLYWVKVGERMKPIVR